MSDHTTTPAGIDEAELRRLAIEASDGDPRGHEWIDQSDGWTVRVKCDDADRRGAKVASTIHSGTTVGHEVAVAEYIAAANPATILHLLDELARVRQLHAGACDRIAAAHEVIALRAEKDALARLEAWQAEEPDYRGYEVRQYKVLLVEDVHADVTAYRCPSERNDYGSKRDDPARVAVAGTDDKPATLGEMIAAALDLWARLHGDTGGTATATTSGEGLT